MWVGVCADTFSLRDLGHQALMRRATQRMYADRSALTADIKSQAASASREHKFAVYIMYTCFDDISAFVHFLLCSKNCPMCESSFFNGQCMLKIGSTTHTVLKRYCALLSKLLKDGTLLGCGKEVFIYGDR